MFQTALPFPDIANLFPPSQSSAITQSATTLTMFRLFRDRSLDTAEHVVIMGVLVEKLARLIGIPAARALRLGLAAQLHDVGKMGIPDVVLNKPGKLTPEEYATMQCHTTWGHDILRHSQNPLFVWAAVIARQHHERWNGWGYPLGLKGEDIHLFGRLAAICDVFDALCRNRVYRAAWPADQVYDHLCQEREKTFDPLLLDIFLANFSTFQSLQQSTEITPLQTAPEAAI